MPSRGVQTCACVSHVQHALQAFMQKPVIQMVEGASSAYDSTRACYDDGYGSVRCEIYEMFARFGGISCLASNTCASAHPSGIIDPRDTRDVLAMAISISLNAPWQDSGYGVFRM